MKDKKGNETRKKNSTEMQKEKTNLENKQETI